MIIWQRNQTMQIVNLILALITLSLKFIDANETKKKDLKNELNEAVTSHDLSKLNVLIDKLR